ncbi:esterase-like activity of phytase family protein [Erythrobacter sp. YT30]|uniref:esterase-like activity of phytase family protein n=1 Tax=Erythrobacter sp. YT30 TaxID=1735012 RepID=UPI0018D20425|nr:esterase-like activity of phytase family protein [Erythrobacter sp. YT30]
MNRSFAQLAVFTLTGLALGASQHAFAQEDIWPETLAVDLNAEDPEIKEVGELIYKGGVKIRPGEHTIGGISSLEWHDGALWTVSDDGRWMRIVPDEAGAQLVDLTSMDMGTLRDLDGKELKKKELADAEAITRDPDGGWLVAFERDHRIWRYETLDGAASVHDTKATDLLEDAEPNGGLETLTYSIHGLLACGEWTDGDQAQCIFAGSSWSLPNTLTVPSLLAEHGGAPVDASCAENGTCYILFRSYLSGYGNRAAIVSVNGEETTTLAIFDAPLTLDNFEGLAVREHNGRRYLYLASDDNFNNCFEKDRDGCQNTLIMKFEIRQENPPPPPVANAPEPDGTYETTKVILETSMGDITVALETERAPITAANFLRYADEDRFDGTVFYRAMHINWGDQPNGLIQGGTQWDPKRILPGIQHEPTTETGLSHTVGALSMAMGEPGTANGDFSIMLGDQTGLDANPQSDDPVWQNGYAVFGYVTDGMDVVAAIHASPTDPEKGEGVMQGQMLAEPVTIIDVRRLEPRTQ